MVLVSVATTRQLVEDFALIVSTLDGTGGVSLVTASGDEVPLPEALRQVLSTAARAMSSGQDIIVADKDRRVTAQEAADYLGVSRPTLIRILDLGEIPYERPRNHRRIKLADLVAYKADHENRRAALDDLLTSSGDLEQYDTGEFVKTRSPEISPTTMPAGSC